MKSAMHPMEEIWLLWMYRTLQHGNWQTWSHALLTASLLEQKPWLDLVKKAFLSQSLLYKAVCWFIICSWFLYMCFSIRKKQTEWLLFSFKYTFTAVPSHPSVMAQHQVPITYMTVPTPPQNPVLSDAYLYSLMGGLRLNPGEFINISVTIMHNSLKKQPLWYITTFCTIPFLSTLCEKKPTLKQGKCTCIILRRNGCHINGLEHIMWGKKPH